MSLTNILYSYCTLNKYWESCVAGRASVLAIIALLGHVEDMPIVPEVYMRRVYMPLLFLSKKVVLYNNK